MALLAAGLCVAQTSQPVVRFSVEGHPGQAAVTNMGGKRYVEVEELLRLTNGSVSFRGSELVLKIPGNGPAPETLDESKKQRFSKDFLQMGIEAMTVIREWRIAIVHAVQNNLPVSENWVARYRRTAESKLALVSSAVTNAPDRDGLLLLQNELANMQAVSAKYVTMHDNLTYTAPDSFENDPLDQRILGCARGLAALAANGQFQDVLECH